MGATSATTTTNELSRGRRARLLPSSTACYFWRLLRKQLTMSKRLSSRPLKRFTIRFRKESLTFRTSRTESSKGSQATQSMWRKSRMRMPPAAAAADKRASLGIGLEEQMGLMSQLCEPRTLLQGAVALCCQSMNAKSGTMIPWRAIVERLDGGISLLDFILE